MSRRGAHDPAVPECCGERLHWLVAEATVGSLKWQLLRCVCCEAAYRTGWRPPSWGNKIAETCYHLQRQLEAAVAAAYGMGEDPDDVA